MEQAHMHHDTINSVNLVNLLSENMGPYETYIQTMLDKGLFCYSCKQTPLLDNVQYNYSAM
jgi:hypothetical protein